MMRKTLLLSIGAIFLVSLTDPIFAQGFIGVCPSDQCKNEQAPVNSGSDLVQAIKKIASSDSLELVQKYSRHLKDKSPEQRAQLKAKLTKAFAAREMTANKVLKERPGLPNLFIPVNVDDQVSFISAEKLETLSQSTAPVMRALRDLLQKIYSLPPEKINPETLGISHIPLKAQKELIQIIKESIHYMPKLHEEKFKNYPFLGLAGFDTVIQDPGPNSGDLDGTFFKYSLSTPSGLTSNLQLLQDLHEQDPQASELLTPYLPKENSFGLLKKTIEDAAQAWTKNPQGISVVVGPGFHSGAHAEAAMIAQLSGMPLVALNDLYEDGKGNIRLNVGQDKLNPVVTGIYATTDDAFLKQNSDDALLFKSHAYANNEKLGKELGVTLKPGVKYQFIYGYDQQGQFDYNIITGVFKDSSGNPLEAINSDVLGLDPLHPKRVAGNILAAVKKGKLYVSNLGARTVESKKLFQLVHDHLALSFTDKKTALIAHPPQELTESEFAKFLQTSPEKLTDYVVKEIGQDLSDKVFVLAHMNPEERSAIFQRLSKNPEKFLVQKFHELKKHPTTDWRIFTLLDHQGKLHSFPQSVVVRNLSSEQSRLGIGAVVQSHPNNEVTPALNLAVTPYFVESKQRQLHEYLNYLDQLITWAKNGDPLLKTTIDKFISFHRNLLEILGPDFTSLITDARQYQEGHLSLSSFASALEKSRLQLQAPTQNFPVAGVKEQLVKKYHVPLTNEDKELVTDYIRRLNTMAFNSTADFITLGNFIEEFLELHKKMLPFLGKSYDWYTEAFEQIMFDSKPPYIRLRALTYKLRNELFLKKDILNPKFYQDQLLLKILAEYVPPLKKTGHVLPTSEELAANYTLLPLDTPVITSKMIQNNDTIHRLITGAYTASTDPYIQGMIDRLGKQNGKLLKIADFNVTQNTWCSTKPNAFFNVEDKGKTPNICANLEAPYVLSALKHEDQHFQYWQEFRDRFMMPGVALQDAGYFAQQTLLGSMMRVVDERAAVSAEFAAEKDNSSLFNRGYGAKASSIAHLDFIARYLYPEIEGIRDFFHKKRWHNMDLDEKQILSLMKKIIHDALRMRKEYYEYHQAQAKKFKLTDPLKSLEEENMAHQVLYQDIFALIFNGSLERFITNQSATYLSEYFNLALKHVKLSSFKITDEDPLIFKVP